MMDNTALERTADSPSRKERIAAALLALDAAHNNPADQIEILDRFADVGAELRTHLVDEAAVFGTGVTAPFLVAILPRYGSFVDYDLRRKVGEGSYGVVYLAQHRRLKRPVAIKLYRGDLASDMTVARFVEEAQIASQLDHPGIPPVHELGTLPEGHPFIVMKFVPQATWAELLAAQPAALRRHLEIFLRVCRTLAYAHVEKGVIHRDLKPANVMLGAFGEVFVMDWGVAKVLRGPGDRPALETIRTEHRLVTEGTRYFGTPLYMSPEQLCGHAEFHGPWTDVFGLGAILCEILTGAPPYGTEATGAKARLDALDLTAAFARLDAAVAAGAEQQLCDLARACLQPDPRDRPPDAAAVVQRLEAYFEHRDTAAREHEIAARTYKARAVALLCALVAGLVLVGGGVWGWRYLSERAEAAALKERNETRATTELETVTAALRQDRLDAAQVGLSRLDGLLSQGLAAALVDHTAAATRDLKFARQREELRLVRDDDEPDRLALAVLLREYGLDLSQPDAAAARIRAAPISAHLLAALDQWAYFETQPSVRRAVLTVAHAASVDRFSWARALRHPDAPADPASRAAALQAVPVEQLSPLEVESLVWSLRRLGADPEPVLRRASGQHRNDYWLNYLLARASAANGHTLAALGPAHAAVALQPSSSAALELLGELYLATEQLDEALDTLQQARDRARAPVLSLTKKSATIHCTLGQVWLRKGEPERASEAAATAERLDATLPQVHQLRAAIATSQGDADAARRAHAEAARLQALRKTRPRRTMVVDP